MSKNTENKEVEKLLFLTDFLNLKQQSRAMITFHIRNYTLLSKGNIDDLKTIAEWSLITGIE